jgi:DNA polymerase III subunit beta
MATKSPPAKSGLHITVERSHLLRALTAVTKAVENRNTYPILANVLLTAEADTLKIRGTDLDVEITSSCPAKCVPGVTTVPAKTLLEIVRKLPDGAEVTMVLADDTLIVKAGRSRFQLSVIDPESFPELGAGDFTATFTTDLSALFGPVQFAISNEETRFYLNGIYMHTVNGKLRVVATDGHRMARHDGEAAPDFTGIIVPKKTVGLVPPGKVQVELSATKIRITSGDVVMLSKLIEGTFPDYERVTPKNNDKVLSVDRSALGAALDRVSIIASDRGGKAVKLTVGEGLLIASVTNPDHGEATEEMAVASDLEFEVGYNASYLSEILRVAGGVEVKFAWNDAGSPALIEGDNDNWLGVLMPMRV